MQSDFLGFFLELEKDHSLEMIELRLHFQKKMNKYMEFKCLVMAADLNQIRDSYLRENKRLYK